MWLNYPQISPPGHQTVTSPYLYSLLFLFLHLFNFVQSAKNCLQPDVPENCHVIFAQPGPYPSGTVAKYNCALGFERIGVEERVCQSNGTWSKQAPICGLDVAQNKPAEQSSGQQSAQNAVNSIPNCALTDHSKSSWWTVSLLGQFNVRAISITLGHLSSEITDIRLETPGKNSTSCAKHIGDLKNSTTVFCAADRVSHVVVHAASRLHLCSFKVYAINAQSPWQCALPSMDILTINMNHCYSSSRTEKLDWKSAQKRCLDLGGTLPIRISPEAQSALKASLTAAQTTQSFYWIGLMGTHSRGWVWADGDPLNPTEEDWYEDPGETKEDEAMAAVMGRPAGWKWMPAAQSVWNPWICQTKPKFCTSPGVSANGRVVFSSQSYAIGTYAFYSCESGFELFGESRRRCEKDGRWSAVIPECKLVDCGEPEEWIYGRIEMVNRTTTFGAVAEYVCRRGTVIESNRSPFRTCGVDSTWSGEIPTCVDVDCGQPPSIANGIMHFSNTTLTSSVNYSCDENYRLIGHTRSFCSENGNWLPNPPVCYDMLTLKEINDHSSDSNLVLSLVVVVLLVVLLLVALKASHHRFANAPALPHLPGFNSWLRRSMACNANGGKSPASSDAPRPLVYATPSQLTQPMDSMIYYAPTGLSMMEQNVAMTQIEVPPHMVSVQRLPNGMVSVRIPTVQPLLRPSIFNVPQLNVPNLALASVPERNMMPASPTSSQILYSFDHEPYYDNPPDSIYEELVNGTKNDNTQHTVC